MSIFFLSVFSSPRLMRLATACFLGLSLAGGPALAQDKVDANSAPNAFVQTVADNALNALKKDQAVKPGNIDSKIGRASGRERVCQYGWNTGDAVYLNKKKTHKKRKN